VFGSQPPISVAAPMPIHSRQRLPFANMAPQVCLPYVYYENHTRGTQKKSAKKIKIKSKNMTVWFLH